MSRWTIEKDGTGIEKSGTGIEKSGTGIEKSGTGIEKSGTGVERSGTGIQRVFVACAISLFCITGNIQANPIHPNGSLQVVVDQETIAVSWIIDGSIFSGIAPLIASSARLDLTEISLSPASYSTQVTGNGTGSSKLVTGNGTGSSKMVTGNGTGSSKQVTGNGTGDAKLVTGNGTGLSVQVTGNGTGSSTLVTGNGTGSSALVTGNGTGSSRLVTGNGTGSSILVTGNGTGNDSVSITLPNGTGLGMDISLSCNTANVTVVDASFAPVVTFENVNVIGNTGLCGGVGSGRVFSAGYDFISN